MLVTIKMVKTRVQLEVAWITQPVRYTPKIPGK